nr:Dihydrofolate reductase [uncultured bacterium]
MKDKLLWCIPEDLKRFRELTRGHPVIMGRKTFESIVGYRGKPLPDRTNIVVTRDAKYHAKLEEQGFTEVLVAGSVEEAIEIAKKQPGADVICVIGGAQIYEQSLPYLDKLCLTLIDDSAPADAFFPEYEKEFTEKTFQENREWNGIKYTWMDLERATA